MCPEIQLSGVGSSEEGLSKAQGLFTSVQRAGCKDWSTKRFNFNKRSQLEAQN